MDSNSLYPSFSLKYLQNNYHLSDCTNEEKLSFLDALLKRSKMRWCEIEQANKSGLGKENIDRNSIKVPIPSVVKEDAKIWALRFKGKAPMVGYREGEIFHILWIDRDFTLYNHS